MTPASASFRHSLATSVVLVAALRGDVVARAPQAVPPRPPDAARFAPHALEKYDADWRAAARAHVSSEFDEPAVSIARWPTDQTRVVVERAVQQLQRERAARRERRIPGDEDSTAVIAKGLVLHTDIAIAERVLNVGTIDRLLVDAKLIESRRFSTHWDHARRLADALGRYSAEEAARDGIGTPTIAIARAWYRAIGALFQRSADLGHLHTHLTAGDGVLRDDPVLLLYRGTLHQAYADPRLQSHLMDVRKSMRGLPDGIVGAPGLPFYSAWAELESAERALRRALALDPSLVEAKIRLAHVLDSRGKPAEAAALARQALAGPVPTFLEYYGAMVLGRATATLGNHTEASAAFERAAARYPRSQTARVALSHVAIGGSPGMAADALVQALGPDVQERADDPWSLYFRLHEPDAQTLLEALRASVP